MYPAGYKMDFTVAELCEVVVKGKAKKKPIFSRICLLDWRSLQLFVVYYKEHFIYTIIEHVN